jgi:Tfp pilus assembly protein FimT
MELVIWLAIIGTLSLIGARMFQGMSVEFRVRRAVREVAALLEWVRWEAVRSGEVLRVEFDPAQEQITVFRGPEGSNHPEQAEVVRRIDLREQHPGVGFGAARQTSRTSGCLRVNEDGIHIQDRAVRFHPTGTTDRSGSLYLIPDADLPDHRDRMAALSILLATGRIQLWRYDPWADSECSDWGGWVPLY